MLGRFEAVAAFARRTGEAAAEGDATARARARALLQAWDRALTLF